MSSSGGQRQRVAIARAIVLRPELLVADEPVSMLDVSVRAGILNLFKRFRNEMGMSIVYVSHDLATIRYLCDRTAVLYLGRIAEIGPRRKSSPGLAIRTPNCCWRRCPARIPTASGSTWTHGAKFPTPSTCPTAAAFTPLPVRAGPLRAGKARTCNVFWRHVCGGWTYSVRSRRRRPSTTRSCARSGSIGRPAGGRAPTLPSTSSRAGLGRRRGGLRARRDGFRRHHHRPSGRGRGNRVGPGDGALPTLR